MPIKAEETNPAVTACTRSIQVPEPTNSRKTVLQEARRQELSIPDSALRPASVMNQIVRDDRVGSFAGMRVALPSIDATLPIRLLPTPPTCRVLPGSGVKLCVGRCGDVARDAEQGTEGVERIELAGPAADPVLIRAHHPRAELVEDLERRLVARQAKLSPKLHERAMTVPTVNPVSRRHLRQRKTPGRFAKRNGSPAA